MDHPNTNQLERQDRPVYRRGPHFMALFAALFTLPLLYVGGSVTTYRVGLAVPDWPTTFGMNMFLYDFWNAPFGVKVEHTHRLYGAAVGLATIGVCAWLLAFDSRRWMRVLGVVAVIGVIVQGLLGGARVMRLSTTLAAVHGCTGQAFFGLMVAIAVLCGRNWLESPGARPDPDRLRPRSFVLAGLVAMQVVLGAWQRHFGSPAVVSIHAIVALGIWVQSVLLLGRVRRHRVVASDLTRPAWVHAIATTLQIVLGIVTLFYILPMDGLPRPIGFYQAVFRTGHQTNGALLLAASIVLVLRAFRHLGTVEAGHGSL